MTDLTCDTDTRVTCAICKRKGPSELMKTFAGGFVHHLCDRRERALWRTPDNHGEMKT